MSKKSLFYCAQNPHILKNSLRTSLFVGTLLAFINHTDSILAWRLSSVEIIQILTTYAVPFLVATYAAAKHAQHFGGAEKNDTACAEKLRN